MIRNRKKGAKNRFLEQGTDKMNYEKKIIMFIL